MSKYLILILFIAGCACLGPATISTIPTPVEQLWNTTKQTNWLATISILGIAAGVFALMNSNKIGIPATVASCISLFMTLAVARFAVWMAICGLIGSTVICVASILLKNKALKDIIIGVQTLKFDNPNGSKILQAQQSKSTQRLVQQIKGDLKVREKI